MSRHEHGADTQQQRKKSAQVHVSCSPSAEMTPEDYARTVDAAPQA
jgi:hypothetical protein